MASNRPSPHLDTSTANISSPNTTTTNNGGGGRGRGISVGLNRQSGAGGGLQGGGGRGGSVRGRGRGGSRGGSGGRGGLQEGGGRGGLQGGRGGLQGARGRGGRGFFGRGRAPLRGGASQIGRGRGHISVGLQGAGGQAANVIDFSRSASNGRGRIVASAVAAPIPSISGVQPNAAAAAVIAVPPHPVAQACAIHPVVLPAAAAPAHVPNAPAMPSPETIREIQLWSANLRLLESDIDWMNKMNPAQWNVIKNHLELIVVRCNGCADVANMLATYGAYNGWHALDDAFHRKLALNSMFDDINNILQSHHPDRGRAIISEEEEKNRDRSRSRGRGGRRDYHLRLGLGKATSAVLWSEHEDIRFVNSSRM
eukprot:1157086_1